MTMTRAFDNDLIRDVTLEHRVNTVVRNGDTGITVLMCDCGKELRSVADPEDAVRRLWKSHALHVSVQLMTIGDDQ